MEKCALKRKEIAEGFKSYQKIFIALGDETRQKIIITLLENERFGMRVPEITKQTSLSRPAVSHHLLLLKQAGLLSVYRKGTVNYYYLNVDENQFIGLKDFIEGISSILKEAKDNGYPHLEELNND